MPTIQSPKCHRGLKVKPIAKRKLSKKDLKPIVYPERTDSQNERLRVLNFLENRQIHLSNPREFLKLTQQEATDLYYIPRHIIQNWVRMKAEFERVRWGSQRGNEEWEGYMGQVLWPELEDQ